MSKWTYWLFMAFMGISVLITLCILEYLQRYMHPDPVPTHLVILVSIGVLGPMLCIFIFLFANVPNMFTGKGISKVRVLLAALLICVVVFNVHLIHKETTLSFIQELPTIPIGIKTPDLPGAAMEWLESFLRQKSFIPVFSNKISLDNFVAGIHPSSNLKEYRDIEAMLTFEDSSLSFFGKLEAPKIENNKIKAWLSMGQIQANGNTPSAIKSAFLDSLSKRLGLNLSLEEKRKSAETHTENLEAYKLYIEGLTLYSLYSREALKEAIHLFSKSKELDPSFPCPYAGIADCYSQLYAKLWFPSLETLQKAEPYVAAALALGAEAMHPHKAAGLLYQNLGAYYFGEWDSLRKEESLDTALTYFNLAVKEYKKAIGLAPRCSIAKNNLATVHMGMASIYKKTGDTKKTKSEFDKAENILTPAIKENPFFPPLYTNYGILLGEKCRLGFFETSKESLILLDSSITYLSRGLSYSATESEKVMVCYNLACAYSLKGDCPSSIKYLKQSLSYTGLNVCKALVGDNSVYLKADQTFDNCRNEEEFKRILDKCKSQDAAMREKLVSM